MTFFQNSQRSVCPGNLKQTHFWKCPPQFIKILKSQALKSIAAIRKPSESDSEGICLSKKCGLPTTSNRNVVLSNAGRLNRTETSQQSICGSRDFKACRVSRNRGNASGAPKPNPHELRAPCGCTHSHRTGTRPQVPGSPLLTSLHIFAEMFTVRDTPPPPPRTLG